MTTTPARPAIQTVGAELDTGRGAGLGGCWEREGDDIAGSWAGPAYWPSQKPGTPLNFVSIPLFAAPAQ